MEKLYKLPQLKYGYKDLEPYISEQQLTIHHQKHHQAYVNGANAILEKLDKARKAAQEGEPRQGRESADLDMKSTLKELSFNIGGHLLHSLFWENLAPAEKGGGGQGGKLADIIKDEFGSFERFKKEFTQTAISVEGSGWAALVFDPKTERPILMQIEKHNVNIVPTFKILLVLDVFEHAYYLDYKNERAKFIEAFWNIANWEKISERLG